jgi:hypothetical protein
MQELVTGLDTSLGECFAPHSQYAICASHYPLKKHDELQFEKDNGINGGPTTTGIRVLYELTDKREIQCSLQMPIEVVLRDQLFY